MSFNKIFYDFNAEKSECYHCFALSNIDILPLFNKFMISVTPLLEVFENICQNSDLNISTEGIVPIT